MSYLSHRLIFIVISLSIVLSIISAWTWGQLYPIVPCSIALSVISLLGMQFYYKEYTVPYLIGFIVLSTFYRVFLYLYPSSFTAKDSDKYAFYIAKLLNGSVPSTLNLGFYSEAPIFLITGQISTVATGGSLRIGLVFPAIIVGIVYPLAAFVLSRYLPISDSSEVAYLAAAITVLAPTSVSLTSNPVAQTQSAVLILSGMILLLLYLHRTSVPFLFLAILCFGVSLLTHKLAPYLVTISLIFAASIGFAYKPLNNSDTVFGILGIAMAGGLYLQSILTNFDYAVISRVLLILGIGRAKTTSGAQTTIDGVFTASAAEPLLPHSLMILLNVSHQIIMFPLAGIGGLVLLWKGYNSVLLRLILGIVTLEIFLTIAATFDIIPGGPFRFLLLIIPLLAVLIAVFSVSILQLQAWSKFAIRAGLVTVLLISLFSVQAISPIASSDASMETRSYLTAPELSGKIWGETYVPGVILTDDFYAQEIPPSKINDYAQESDTPPSHYQGSSRKILNGQINQTNSCTIALRPSLSRYSYHGRWRLTQPVTTGFQEHNRIYSSGETVMFKQPSCN